MEGACVEPRNFRQARLGSGPRYPNQGFTLVELVVVMVLMAVLTTVSLSRFGSREPFAVQSTADQLLSGLRLAQATAVAQRATLYVSLGADPASLSLCLDAPCTQPLPAPGGGPWLEDASGVRLAAALAYSLNGRGEPSFVSAQTVQVSSVDGSVNAPPIRIEAVSGHVHVP